MDVLSDLAVVIKAKLYGLFSHPTVILGINGSGDPVPLLLNAAGGLAPAANAATAAATFSQGTKAVAAAGTPVALVGVSTLVESVEIHARKNPTTANTGNIYVGFSAVAGQNYRVLGAGESISITAPAGKKLDLALIYLDAATNADAVTYTATN